jgi:hypothetical protein
MVPGSTPVVAAGQGRSSSLAKRKVLLVSSSVVQACMPWMAAPRNERMYSTAACGFMCQELVLHGSWPYNRVLYGWQRSRMPSGRPSPRWAVERV